MKTERTLCVSHKVVTASQLEMAEDCRRLSTQEIEDWQPQIETRVGMSLLPTVWDTGALVSIPLEDCTEEVLFREIKRDLVNMLMIYGPWKDRDKMVFKVMSKRLAKDGKRWLFYAPAYWKEEGSSTWQCTLCDHIQSEDPDTCGRCEKCSGPLERTVPIGKVA